MAKENTNPPSPSFPMEHSNLNNDGYEIFKKRIEDGFLHNITPEQAKVLQEQDWDSMTMPYSGYKIYWRPNNYRRQMEVSIVQDSAKQNMIATIFKNPKLNSIPKLPSFKNYRPNITIQVGKNHIIGIYSQNKIGTTKETFCIMANNRQQVTDWLRDKKLEIAQKIDKAIQDFCKQFKLRIWNDPIWLRHEDWTETELTKKLPDNAIIYETLWKKVYKEGIEMQGGKGTEPTENLRQHINNSIIYDFAPEIAKELEGVKIAVNPLHWLKSNISHPNEVLKYKDIIQPLKQIEKNMLTKFLFDKFGAIA